jgi:hypothetical protein
MHFALGHDNLLVPSGIELLHAYRTCPTQMLFHFNSRDLDQARFLQPAESGVTGARLSLPLAATLTDQERSDCKTRSRMHPLPGWEDEQSKHTGE